MGVLEPSSTFPAPTQCKATVLNWQEGCLVLNPDFAAR